MQDYYRNNKDYTNFLASHSMRDYIRYFALSKLQHYSLYRGRTIRILDVGSGIGQYLSLFNGDPKIEASGVEVSKTSVVRSRKLKINASVYDGNRIPYLDNEFDIVGSFCVLEHVDSPTDFLNEQLRVLSHKGCLVVASPNFLSITNSYHQRTKGIKRKLLNILTLCKYVVFRKTEFDSIQPTITNVIKPDNDAITLTNPVILRNWAKSQGLVELYWSSQLKISNNRIITLLDKTFFKYFLGASIFVFYKQ